MSRAARALHWRNQRADGSAVIYFLIGIQYDSKIMMKIINENKKYDDLIVTSLKDTYDNLTLKHVPYYIKVDDDVVLDLDRLNQQFILSWNSSNIYGAIRYQDPVIRGPFNRYFMPYKYYKKKFYPPFAIGMMYIMPQEAFRKIWRILPFTIWLRLEDVFYTGIAAEIAGVERINIDFMYSRNSIQTLSNRWECDQYGRSRLVVASSFCNSDDLRKFHRKIREIACLKHEYTKLSIETFWQKLKKILSNLNL
uniref:Hexosyltransferase n=1 Tax=Setaria digitata TaxID=48799 RepID=A0A915Q1F1_9BILA